MSRLDLETALHASLGGLLAFAYQKGTDPDTGEPYPTDRPIEPTGSTAVYSGPIGYGLGYAGGPVSSPYNPTDADVAAIPPGKSNLVLDLARYRLIIDAALGNTDVNETELDVSVQASQLPDRWLKVAESIRGQYASVLEARKSGGMSGGLIRDLPPTAYPPPWGPGFRGRAACGPRWRR